MRWRRSSRHSSGRRPCGHCGAARQRHGQRLVPPQRRRATGRSRPRPAEDVPVEPRGPGRWLPRVVHRQFGERHSRDQRLAGQRRWIGDAPKQDHRARVENTAHALSSHRRESSVESMSLRSRSGSTAGRCRHRASSTDAGSGRAGIGLNSATALPARVIVTCSPCARRQARSRSPLGVTTNPAPSRA